MILDSEHKQHRFGKYQILEELGRGGFGTVYKAQDTVLGRLVAIKILHAALVIESNFIERFRQEARTAAMLDHPNLVPVFDFGETEGRYYIAMGYMPGGSLKDLLKREGKLESKRAYEVLAQVCEGLEYAHTRGIIHRDLKPGNILFDENGKARLADMGFARVMCEGASRSMSASGSLVGTPAYMAPETWRNKPATPQTDIYSLGCILYEMLTGKVLFEGESPAEIMTMHVIDGPQYSNKLTQDMPAVLDKALQRDPQQRFVDVKALLQGFRFAVEPPQKETVTPPIPVEPDRPIIPGGSESNETKTDDESSSTEKPRKSKRTIGIIGVIIGLFLVSIIVWVSGHQQKAGPQGITATNPPPITDTKTSLVQQSSTATKTTQPTPMPTQPTPIIEFVNLPEPKPIVEKLGNAWQTHAGVNLASSMVMRDGVLWTASGNGGVVAWDTGSGQFKQYTINDGLCTNQISSLALSNDNQIWAGSWEACISRFNGSVWETVESQGLSQIVAGTSDGSIWAASPYNESLGLFEEDGWKIFTANNPFPSGSTDIAKVIPDPNGGIWVLIYDVNSARFLGRYQDGNWKFYSSDDGLPQEDYVVLNVSNKSELWLIDMERNIWKFDGQSCRIVATLVNYDFSPWVLTSAVMPDDVLLLANFRINSQQFGMVSLDGETLSFYTASNGLPTNSMYSLFIDPEGYLWASTPNGLARKEAENGWRTYDVTGLISSGEVHDMAIAKDGSIWVAPHGGGVGHYQENEWQNYSTQEDLVSDSFWSITIAPDDTIWFGSWNQGNIMSFDGSTWKSYGEDLGLISGGYVWDLASANDGKIWAGTNNGIASFDGDKWKMFTPAEDQSLNDVRSIIVDLENNVWMGTYSYETGGQVARLSDGSWRVYGEEDGLIAGDAVMALEVSPEGILYAGTYNGLFCLIDDRWEAVVGAPGNINDIAFSDDGSLWIATEFNGIMKFDNDLVFEVGYQLGDGLPGFRLYSIEIDSDGTVWVGGEGGVVSISPGP